MRLIEFFQAVLVEQLDYQRELSNHIINIQDVMLEDIVAVGGSNAPGIKAMNNQKFEIVAKTSGMSGYAGSQGGGVHKSAPGFGRSEVEVRYVRAYFTMTHEQLVAVTQPGAVLDASKEYAEEIKAAMARAKSRHLRGDGSGISGVLPAGAVTGTNIVISGRTAGAITTHNIYGLGTDEFMEGEPVLFGTAAMLDGGTAVEATIDYVVNDTTLALTASVTVGSAAGANNRGGTNADTWYIVRGTRADNEWKKAPIGIFGMVDDGTLVPTFQGQTRATTPWMKSIVLYKANATNIIADFRELYNKYIKYGRPAYFKASTDVYDKYTNALTLNAQIVKNGSDYKSKLGAGHSGLAFQYGNSGELPILNDNFFPAGTVVLIDPKMFFEASLFNEDFVPGYFMRSIDASQEIAYETVRAAYMNFGTYGSRKLGARIHYTAV
jgi:hypothetical protein